jgi:pyruvate-formate lyase-activating enzyme
MPNLILLINPCIHDFAAYDFWLRPMGLLYITSRLRQWGFEVQFLDCLDRYNPRLLDRQDESSPGEKPDGRGKFHKEDIPKPPILRDIPRRYSRYGLPHDLFLEELALLHNPSVILVTSSMTYWYPGVQETIALTRSVFPDATMILGGTYATLLPEHARAHSRADYVIEGGAINKLGQILESLTGRPIPRSENSPFPSEADTPAYNLLRSTSSMVVFTSWGCPFRCTYCASWKVSGEFRQREPRRVVDEIEFLSKEHHTGHFAFYDDALLFAKQKHFKPMIEDILARKIKAAFHTPNAIHPRYVDRDIAVLMREANFQTICLGLETTSPEVQRRTGSKVNNSDFINAVACLEQAGYHRKEIEVYAMMGLPGQDADEVRETLRFINEEGCTIRLLCYSPIPGTEEWQRAVVSSDLPLAADPLLHNPSVYPVRNKRMPWSAFEGLKSLTAELNSNLVGRSSFG